MFEKLTKDQKERLDLLKIIVTDCSRQEMIDALENNFWDTAMASEWIKLKKENPDASLEEFHSGYDAARQKSAAVLPSDRYDVPNSKSAPAATNRKARRDAMRAEKKNKKNKKK